MTTQQEKFFNEDLKALRKKGLRQDFTQQERDDFDVEVHQLLKRRVELDNEKEIAEAMKGLSPAEPDTGPYGNGAPSMSNGLYSAMKAQGFHGEKGQQPVIVAVDSLYGVKSDLISDAGNAEPRRIALVQSGRDQRYIFPSVPHKPLAVGETRIDYLKQTTRTIPSPTDVQLAIDAVTEKAIVDSVATLTSKAPIWHAVVSNDQPLVLLKHPELRTMLDGDMSQAIRESLDDMIIDEVDGFTGQLTRSQSTDTILDFLRRAKGDLEDVGFTPNAVWLNNADNETIDLLKDNDDRYFLGENSGIWGLNRIASSQVPAGTCYVLDTSAVQLYASPLQVEVDFAQGFSTNTGQVRTEMVAATVVRNGNATLKGTLA